MEHPINGELIPQGGGDSIPLNRSPLVLGRRETCDICLQFPNVSGKHCELTFKEGIWILRDLDSTNGIKVNGVRVLKKIIHTGDVITIAKRSFTLQYDETGRSSDLPEFEEEVAETMSVPLLEKAGIAHDRRHASMPPQSTKTPTPG
jgi:pSer/pThr/pTyr-binding forkhead associated (FHA) protein